MTRRIKHEWKPEEKEYWKKIELADEREIEKINRMIDRKETKELDKWLKRWQKEGDFWVEEKSKKDDWL